MRSATGSASMSARSAIVGPGRPVFRIPDHPGLGNAGLHGEPQFAQVIGYYLCRAHFAVGKFRVLVEVAPPDNDFRINGIERAIEFRGRAHTGTNVATSATHGSAPRVNL